MPGKAESQYFSGKGKWVRVSSPDPWGNYKIDLYPNAASLEKIKKLKDEGLKNQLRKDDDGYFITIRRPSSKLIRGKVIAFTPPQLLKPDGTPLTGISVGNGSDVTVKVDVYAFTSPQGAKGKAIRLDAVRVDNLVPFDAKADFAADQKEQIGELQSQPEPVF